jgi:uncharacterized membrane protein
VAETPEQPDDSPSERVSRPPVDILQGGGATSGSGATIAFVQAEYSGTLPTAQMLGDYNNVLPGLAERIVVMAEKEQDHNHKLERWYATLRFTGQLAAFIIALAGLIIGGLLIRDGHNIEGLATLFLALGPIVGAFLYRQIKGGNGN